MIASSRAGSIDVEDGPFFQKQVLALAEMDRNKKPVLCLFGGQFPVHSLNLMTKETKTYEKNQ